MSSNIKVGSVVACSFARRKDWRTPVRFVGVVKEVLPKAYGFEESYLVKVLKQSHKGAILRSALVLVHPYDIEWAM